MSIYEKKYLGLWKGSEKITECGLLKISVWGRKIKLDFFLDHLPFPEPLEGICRLAYIQIAKPESGEESSDEQSWQIAVRSGQGCYCFQRYAEGELKEIKHCFIRLGGGYEIRPADEAAVKWQLILEAEQPSSQKPQAMLETEQQPPRQEAGRNITFVRDLKLLLQKGEGWQELYYNSFLLHGFYQYRHIIEGDGFIGVPGNFYEREAIAAKMMGFSFFLENEYIAELDKDCLVPIGQDVNMNNRKRPAQGAFGYYLRAVE